MAAIAAVNPDKNTGNITVAALDGAGGSFALCQVVASAGRGDTALEILLCGG